MPSDSDVDVKVSLTLRSMVTGDQAGSIIGRGGEVINNIRDESKAAVRIEAKATIRGERIITVDGPTDAIFKAYTLICKVLEQKEKERNGSKSRSRSPDTSSSSSIELKLLVPSSQCGALIGKEGSKVKEMRESTGADIQISPNPQPHSSEREVKLRGNRESVTQGIFHICGLLLENPARGETRLYKPLSRNDRDYRMSDRDSFSSGMRIWDRDMDYRSDRGGSHRSRRDDMPPRYSMGGGGTGNFAVDAILEFARRHEGRGRDMRGMGGGDRDIRFEMMVSNENVGSVIGKRGAKINEIRQMSGANVNIMESGKSKERRGGNDRTRVIEIIGSQEQVALAKSLITIALEMRDSQDDRRGFDRNEDRGMRGGPRGDRSRSRDRNSRYEESRRRW